MNKAFAYGISALIVGFGLSMLIADLNSTAPAALWAITALIPIAIGILSAFGPCSDFILGQGGGKSRFFGRCQ